MSNLALARKWRPRGFSELIGQDHVKSALINSLEQQRLHHAYLFTGTRGVGKTSIARLLAKALNCELGISATPCLTCNACKTIADGSFVDLIEVDAASRTRVEDTRELLENVQYMPTLGRFKIYLIDEVHMLSQHSFNALLKTLEEPPAHVKFLLATTDPQKLPATILSRCLQFSLKPVPTNIIAQQLQAILTAEHLEFELDALNILAKAAAGSVRDALSLLDQVIAASDGTVRTHNVKNSLGYTQQDYALQILTALAAHNPDTLITISRNIAAEGGHFSYVLEEILSYLHQLAIAQSISTNNNLIEIVQPVQQLVPLFSPEDIQLFYQISLKGREELSLAPTIAIGFEMTLLRMYAFLPAKQPVAPPLAYQTTHQTIRTTADALQSATIRPTQQPLTVQENVPSPQHIESDAQNWVHILPQLQLHGLALSAAEHTEFFDKNGTNIILRVTTGHESLFTKAVITRIETALTNYYKEPIKLTIERRDNVTATPAQKRQSMQTEQQQAAEAALQKDHFFQKLQQEFSAQLIKDSVEGVKE